MKPLVFIICLLCYCLSASSSPKTDSVIHQLKAELAKKEHYDKQKLSRIHSIKSRIELERGDLFLNYLQLFEEYEYYKFDSAYVYGKKMLDLSIAGNSTKKKNESMVKMASLLLHAGLFKETFDNLSQINVAALDQKYRYDYYCLKSGAYSNLAIYNDDINFTKSYNEKAIAYLDSAIALCAPNSFELLFTMGNRQVVAGAIHDRPDYFLKLLNRRNLTVHQRARVLTGLAAFYQREDQNAHRIWLLAQSAIADIQSSTKETLATLLLAEDLFNHGQLDDAYFFIQHSRDDAGFYGNRLRKLKIESILPDIAAQVNLATQRDKNKFLIYFLSISLVTVVIATVSFLIFIQLRKLKVKERIIEEKNIELKEINDQLHLINDKLREFATVNEKYIGYFFDMISGYILKLDRLKKNVERKIFTKRFDEILPDLKGINIKGERENLFNTFDSVFLSIFPNFVEVFNSLLNEEDQQWPKAPELLNTDLRIFALMRLGISDVQSIATILEYSANTIYVYKMRIKAKALVPADEFDRIMMTSVNTRIKPVDHEH